MALWVGVCGALTAGCRFDTSALRDEADSPAPADAAVETGAPHPDGRAGDRQGMETGPADAIGVDAPDAVLLPDAEDEAPPVQCTEVATRCSGDDLDQCQGGAWQLVETCPLGCGSSPARCFSFDPVNVPAGILRTGTAAWHVTGAVTVSSDSGSGLPGDVLLSVQPQPGGPDLALLLVASLTVDAEASLAFVGSRPVVIVASDFIQIDGIINVSAKGQTGGPGGYKGGERHGDGAAPDGINPAPHGLNASTYDDSGGSGGCYGAVGGAGGVGGTAKSPLQCPAFGSTTGSPLLGGGGGGGGSGSTHGGLGGGGGGALQLAAYRRITVGGLVLAAGAGGEGGERDSSSTVNWGSGGGGGAGGGVVLEAPTVSIGGAVAANGGGGGGGSYWSDGSGSDGKPGGAGQVLAAGGAGGRQSNPAYGAGGSGGAGTVAAGAPGAKADNSDQNGGGGGGAVGRIAIHTRSGAVPAGTISPPPTPSALAPK